VRRRMKREDRRDALLDLAAGIIQEKGAEALTLQTLADAAGVTKPVTYSQFGTRAGLLNALYRRYDQRFFADFEAGLAAGPRDLEAAAALFADSFLACVARHGRVHEAAIAALRAYPEHRDISVAIRAAFVEAASRSVLRLVPAEQAPSETRMIALQGAAEELGRAVLDGQVGEEEARTEMRAVFTALVAP